MGWVHKEWRCKRLASGVEIADSEDYPPPFCEFFCLASLGTPLTLRQVNFSPSKHPDGLLQRKTIPLHPDLLSASDSATILTRNLDPFLGS